MRLIWSPRSILTGKDNAAAVGNSTICALSFSGGVVVVMMMIVVVVVVMVVDDSGGTAAVVVGRRCSLVALLALLIGLRLGR
jgi:hypothetical protein